MCGRYCLFPDENEEIRRILEEIDAQYGPEAVKTGEIFPTNPAPVLLPQGDGLQPCPMVWGFPKFGGKGVIINSRGETAAEKRMFRSSLLQRRCAIPTTGFYEWDQEKKKYRFNLEGSSVLYLGGFYNLFEGQPRFVIITLAANPSVARVHHRMPLVLRQEDLFHWCGNSGAKAKNGSGFGASERSGHSGPGAEDDHGRTTQARMVSPGRSQDEEGLPSSLDYLRHSPPALVACEAT